MIATPRGSTFDMSGLPNESSRRGRTEKAGLSEGPTVFIPRPDTPDAHAALALVCVGLRCRRGDRGGRNHGCVAQAQPPSARPGGAGCGGLPEGPVDRRLGDDQAAGHGRGASGHPLGTELIANPAATNS